MEIDFLKKVLMHDSEYWVIAKQNYCMDGFNWKRESDSIILVAFPESVRTGLGYEQITLKDLENLHNSKIDCNIFISESFPPFQKHQTLYKVYDGFPLNNVNVKGFLIKALQLDSHNLSDYERLSKDFLIIPKFVEAENDKQTNL